MREKTDVIEKILMRMNGVLNSDQMRQLKESIGVVLYHYSISEIETTEIAVTDGSCTIELFNYFRIGKLSAGKSVSTIEQYWRVVKQLCDMSHKELNTITEEDILRFMVEYKRIHKVSGSTMESKRKYLSSVFSYLMKHRKIKHNPMDLIERVGYKQCVKIPLTDTEIKKVKAACDNNKRNIAIVQFLLDTGTRVSELCNVNLQDIDFETNRCKVLGKGNKERIVTFSKKCARYLKGYLKTRTDIDSKNKIYSSTLPLFTGLYNNRRLHKPGVEMLMRKLGQKSGIFRLHPHLLRATCATKLSRNGVDINIIAKYLGHSGLGSVNRYVLINDEYVTSVVQRSHTA